MKHPARMFSVVVWDDAHGEAGHELTTADDIEKYHKGARYQSYGWVLRSDERGVTLVSEWCPDDGSYRATMWVPRGMVVEERVLRLVGPTKPRKPKI